MEMNKTLWEACAEFHGHECGGLTLGCKAALYAVERLGLRQDESGFVSAEEDLLCVAENNVCSVDAIRVILGCREERGNLLFHLTGQQAYTVFNRRTREAVRIVLTDRPEGLTREEAFAYYQSREPSQLFEATPVEPALPLDPRRTYVCSRCGETAGGDWIRFVNGESLCLDCIAEQEEEN